MPTVDEARQHFPSAGRAVFFDHASISPISIDVATAMRHVADLQAEEGFQTSWIDDVERVRAGAAALVGSHPDDIALAQNTSFGLSLVANGLDWAPGDNVVLPEHEFPSNYYPWINLRDRGVEVRLVPAPGGHADIADVVAAIDPGTRVVAISAVQYSTGFRYDLRPLADACRARDALLVVDGTQCVGALQVDVGEIGADALAVSGHKWLLGPPGAGFVHIGARARERVRPSVVGWLTVPDPFAFDYRLELPASAARYEPGTENVIGALGMGAAIDLLHEFGPAWVESRVIGLTDQLAEGLLARGYRLLSDRSHASGILIFDHPDRTPDAVYELLVRAGVRCAPRGGGVRLSPHCYNTVDEVDAALAAL